MTLLVVAATWGTAWAADVAATGRAEANLRLGLADCAEGCGWVDFHDAAVLGGDLRVRFGRQVRVVAIGDLRAHGPTDIEALEDSGEIEILRPFSLKLHEASVGLDGVGAPWFDLVMGVHRERWGTADGLSLVDNLNPYDLEDPTRLDQRLAVPMLLATAHPGNASIQLGLVPFFVPAALPTDHVDVLAGARDLFDVPGQNATDVREVESRVTMPGDTVHDLAVGGRVALATGPVDLAASWYHGRDSLPQVGGELLLTGFSTDNDRVDVGIPVMYPRIEVAGLEARGELPGELGGWAEVVLVMPERTVATMSAAQLSALATLGAIDEVPDPIPSSVTQDGEPFPRAVVGVERSFGRVYVNAQWLYGFPTERQWSELSHYGLLTLRFTLSDRWILGLRGVSDGGGYLAGAELRYLHGDAAEWWLGSTYIGGSEDSALHGFRGVSHAGTGVEVRF
ncbi:MAG: hypothetical protein FJ102_08290 [Deltaproteobacteria bacterium]|nr:hypothetical protein [Deltaproteobacteria bacterium]